MRRRRINKKKHGKFTCQKCDKFYTSSASLYYHNYHKHRGGFDIEEQQEEQEEQEEIIINENEMIHIKI